jgi:type I restriction-modification system DNA methylase subunit
MITKENLKDVLKVLAFKETQKDIFIKKFDSCELKVDFKNQKLIYPENDGLIVNDKTTSNFSSPENFVVFECVNRLLEQGYLPKHIELEKKWQLGHTQKSGKADIWVKDNNDKSLLIIECKTAGNEYKKAINILQSDSNNQLFSYLQQENSTKFLALYTSDFVDGKVIDDYYLINVTDNEELLKNNPKLKSYKDATTSQEKYKVWCETYGKEYATIGLFENNKPYEIGKTKFSIDDLKSITTKDIQGKYHEFATILRQHNVSGRENAFDKLVNLFLCKVTDEKENPQELKFYWRGRAYDDPFDFQDRLQQLYKIGMDKFLNDEIVYIANDKIDEAFGVFKDKPNVTKDTIKEFIKELKFFTNNDFAFIDVHNEKLFYQNFEVLLKVSKMIQDIKLTESEENQFLGDMFELFLDQGIKQSEGQFFTPMPIVKFIINSLPFKQNPNVIDYACGAGHFLNEYALQNKDAKIVGIEKEYRLSKVAKVSSFMYGNDIEIIYADALSKKAKVEKNSFDVLVANPPYSVKGFLQTLSDEDKKEYELLYEVDTKSYSKTSAIECFFIERAKQLLKTDAVAGIIVPSSILNKDTPKLYTKTREIILENFDIVAISEFGSGTFGKTGTNTVTLFLRKIDNTINLKQHFINIIDEWFSEYKISSELKDEDLVKNYCECLDYDYDKYTNFFKGNFEYSDKFDIEIFNEYKNKVSKEDFIKYAKIKEKEKILYFALVNKQKNDVVIIKSPTKNNKIKNFLGYEWSNRKGNEGIHYITSKKIEINDDIDKENKKLIENLSALKYINTPLYNPQNKDDKTKINKIIKDNFENIQTNISDELKEYVSRAKLVDMIDFKKVDFNKAINLNPAQKIEIKSKWELVRLGNVVEIIAGQSPKSEFYNENHQGLPFYQGKKDFGYKYLKETKIYVSKPVKVSIKDDILMSVRAPVGDVNINPFEKICIGRGLVAIRENDDFLRKYIYYLFSLNKEIIPKKQGSSFEAITIEILKKLQIPLPPIDIQKKIVQECERVDKINEKLKNANRVFRKKIENIIKNIEGKKIKIANILKKIKGNTTKIQQNQILQNGKYPVVTQETEKLISGYTNIDNPITDLPLVVFGDHSCSFKYIDFPFVRGADGTQLLKPNSDYNIKYFYYVLKFTEIPNKDRYERHMKYLKDLSISLINLEKQEVVIKKIEQLELKIAQNQAIIDSSKEKKEEILRKYL